MGDLSMGAFNYGGLSGGSTGLGGLNANTDLLSQHTQQSQSHMNSLLPQAPPLNNAGGGSSLFENLNNPSDPTGLLNRQLMQQQLSLNNAAANPYNNLNGVDLNSNVGVGGMGAAANQPSFGQFGQQQQQQGGGINTATQIELLQQQLQAQQQQLQLQQAKLNPLNPSFDTMNQNQPDAMANNNNPPHTNQLDNQPDNQPEKRRRIDEPPSSSPTNITTKTEPTSPDTPTSEPALSTTPQISKSVSKHLPLIERSSQDGNRLRSYYSLSIDSLFSLPPIPSDEEYCSKLSSSMNPTMLPAFDVAALRAARFAELALCAFVSNQLLLAIELSSATVACLTQCVDEPIHPSCMYDVTRAYFLHGVFRTYRGDVAKYLKYRRVCLTHMSHMSGVQGMEALLAAISFHDSWVYIIFNANDENLPDIDSSIPPLEPCDMDITSSETKNGDGNASATGSATGSITGSVTDGAGGGAISVEEKYQISTDPSKAITHTMNQMWMQGAPSVFLNKEAPPLCRSLDALSCAIRSCCDEINERFDEPSSKEVGGEAGGTTNNDGNVSVSSLIHPSATSLAVTANKEELCPRNMVLSAYKLLQQHETTTTSTAATNTSSDATANSTGSSSVGSSATENLGYHVIITAMDAFLESGDVDQPGGFTESQIQSLLSVCYAVIENPLLLFQAGPTYPIVTNVAILLCHLMNGLYASSKDDDSDRDDDVGINGTHSMSDTEMKAALFDEVLQTYIAVRKVLHIHRQKLPKILRSHGLPRIDLLRRSTTENGSSSTGGFIDIAETSMSASAGCQGFVLMACSPCVAAERAKEARLKYQEEMKKMVQDGSDEFSEYYYGGGIGDKDLENELKTLGNELEVDDDSLLKVLGQIIAA